MIHVQHHAAVAPYRRRALPLMLAREAEYCWGLGLIEMLETDPAPLGQVELWTVDNDGQVLGAAWYRASQSVLGLTEMPPAAVRSLIDSLLVLDVRPGGVAGPRPVCDAFARQWAARTGTPIEGTIRQLVYQLEAVTMPPPVRGDMRVATSADRDLLIDWFQAFARDCHQEMSPERTQAEIDAALARDAWHLWTVDGQTVSMAEVRGPTTHGARISGVYTPPAQRNHGYALALVAAVSQKMLDSGRRFLFLYADADNPAANQIYQRIGYHPIADSVHHVFGETS